MVAYEAEDVREPLVLVEGEDWQQGVRASPALAWRNIPCSPEKHRIWGIRCIQAHEHGPRFFRNSALLGEKEEEKRSKTPYHSTIGDQPDQCMWRKQAQAHDQRVFESL